MRSVHVARNGNQDIGVSILVEIERLNKDHANGRGRGTWVVKAVVPTRIVSSDSSLERGFDVVGVNVLIELE